MGSDTGLSDLEALYTHIITRVVPGPRSPTYLIPFLLFYVALCVPPWTLSHRQLYLTFLPLIYASQIRIAWSDGCMDVISITLTFWSLVLLFWWNPREKWARVWWAEEDSDGKKRIVEERYPENLGRRMLWVLTLLFSARLTGWKVGIESNDRKQPPPVLSKLAYAKTVVYTVIQGYFILDLTSCYVPTDPYFYTSGMEIDEPFPPPSPDTSDLIVMLRLLPPRLVRCSILAGEIYGSVKGMFLLPALPLLALNALGYWPDHLSPHTWPVFFGNFSAIGERGLRGLWGTWWHGMNRHITATHGRGVIDTLDISSKSTLGYTVIVASAFFFSGLIHTGMIPPYPESSFLSASRMRLCIAGFFWGQVPGIGIETVIAKLAGQYAPSLVGWPVSKFLVFVWVTAWLCLTLPLLPIAFREIGYWHYHAVPVSMLRGLAGEGWLTWRLPFSR
ncbi:hypothetical protein ACLMJK_003289 [Lecanora helva]